MHPVYEKLKLVLGLQSISILVPRIWFHVPHPSNGQNMPKTKTFRRQKRRFLDGARLQEFWLRRAGPSLVLNPSLRASQFTISRGTSDSLRKLVPNFLKKCPQFTKSLMFIGSPRLIGTTPFADGWLAGWLGAGWSGDRVGLNVSFRI